MNQLRERGRKQVLELNARKRCMIPSLILLHYPTNMNSHTTNNPLRTLPSVDGNDLLAVHIATAKARKLAIESSGPVFVEAMTYRVGHHSTSDDSTRYRSGEEIKEWQTNDDPVVRYKKHLKGRGWINEKVAGGIKDEERMEVLKALEVAEKKPNPPLSSMFEDVYKVMPKHLKRQEEELLAHVAKYPGKYEIDH
jgi:2-oxoisovalerate dehydrogenase E1 component alpha subunit